MIGSGSGYQPETPREHHRVIGSGSGYQCLSGAPASFCRAHAEGGAEVGGGDAGAGDGNASAPGSPPSEVGSFMNYQSSSSSSEEDGRVADAVAVAVDVGKTTGGTTSTDEELAEKANFHKPVHSSSDSSSEHVQQVQVQVQQVQEPQQPANALDVCVPQPGQRDSHGYSQKEFHLQGTSTSAVVMQLEHQQLDESNSRRFTNDAYVQHSQSHCDGRVEVDGSTSGCALANPNAKARASHVLGTMTGSTMPGTGGSEASVIPAPNYGAAAAGVGAGAGMHTHLNAHASANAV